MPSLCTLYCRSFSLELAWRAGYSSLELSETLYSPGGTLRLAPRASHPMVSSRALETESQATADPQRTLSPESRKAKQIKTKDKEHAPEPSRPLISINLSLDLASPVYILFSPFSCFWLSLGPLCDPACSQPQPLPSCNRSLCHLRHFRQILVLSITFPYPPLINRHAAHRLICRAAPTIVTIFHYVI